ncbi:MAG: hypothetical protein PHV68_09330, partial [Candidatus Gastranaerophilales bacterium]|nr:hypothetical protein [Candidatus Gastranaerophilales bacterium]
YNLSKLNIIGICDLKFKQNKNDKYLGFTKISPDEIYSINPDILIITAKEFDIIQTYLRDNGIKKPIISIFENKTKFIEKTSFEVNLKILFNFLNGNINFEEAKNYKKYLKNNWNYIKTHINYKNVLKRIKKSSLPLKILFLVSDNSKWCAQPLYDEMANNSNIEPLIIVTPLFYGKETESFQLLNENYQFFKNQNMNVIKGYDEEKQKYTDLKKFKPDIVFYQQPWSIANVHMPDYVSKFAITCYIPYACMLLASDETYEKSFVNIFLKKIWRIFAESDFHQEYYSNLSMPQSVIKTGYPKLDIFLPNTILNSEKIWKHQDKKRIIWAPHYSMDVDIKFGNFHKYYKDFYEFAKSSKDIEFILKPHPRLKHQIVENGLMSQEEMTNYFENWDKLENAQIYENGNYFGIFKTSDAMILDCGSFNAEYMVTGKPLLFIENKDRTSFNEFGEKIFEGIYKTSDFEGVLEFINKVVLKGEDTLIAKRQEIIKKVVNLSEQSASSKIIEYLNEEFDKNV